MMNSKFGFYVVLIAKAEFTLSRVNHPAIMKFLENT